ncbi:hypothetical protein LEP1GSC137_0445 [Leptospira borgpetersenii str. Noumea 25]|uniref:Uncharacterized protein n=1 Tax=Leptospira borgpetersenii serovar Ballum TaxID=280505 RepID=A0A0S2ILT8_LEPBO|nr:hypothetical protein LBBP_00211 [Leptospira borgpetersenii serovar Ballum]EKQ98801.1 hypothetical protein LEP1GSC121_0478 [Leptospira borgpetersenii serovar Castellonis str. 200801910]EMO08212.1 hypothetical protein LEP1GSC137_0445 [Leptospira borgpetersenii str. Noumea 25]
MGISSNSLNFRSKNLFNQNFYGSCKIENEIDINRNVNSL